MTGEKKKRPYSVFEKRTLAELIAELPDDQLADVEVYRQVATVDGRDSEHAVQLAAEELYEGPAAAPEGLHTAASSMFRYIKLKGGLSWRARAA